jgi:acyl-CoA thioesterase-2
MSAIIDPLCRAGPSIQVNIFSSRYVAAMSDADRATDQAFLGLVVDGAHDAVMEVTPKLMSPRGSFYGGAGLAAACTMMELATERAAVWSTVQFVSGAERGDRLEMHTDVIAHGHRTSQVRVTARTAGREVFTAVGATGGASGKVTRNFASMPSVSAPEQCARADWPSERSRDETHFGTHELREAVVHGGAEGGAAPSMALWVRVDSHPAWTPALLGYVADVVPMSFHRALGSHRPGGMSLDNSLRVGPRVDTEWVLLALHPEIANQGYAHGTVYLWATDGTLMGTANQTFVLRSG